MLSRCKGKSAANYVRCIAIPASPSCLPRVPSSKEKQEVPAKKEEEEVWDNVLKAIPTSTRWQTLASQRPRKPLDPDFFSSRRFGQSRKYTTDARQGAGSNPSPDEPGSLFNSQESAWDHVFDKIDELPPLASMPVQARPRSTVYASPGFTNTRRQAMTAREIDAFDNMFNMIFDAVQKQSKSGAETSTTGRPRTAADRRADKAARHDPLSGVGIGSGPEGSSPMSDLFGKLRRVSRKFRWSPQEDADLERKLAKIELCESDHHLLEWAAKEVFDESARYEEAARQAVVRAETTQNASEPASSETATDSSPESPTSSASDSEPTPGPSITSPLPLQPPSYPHLLAALIRTFREKFHDPHLALSVFDHARSRSIASYVFGCTVPAYNELLRTRWEAFRDLRGVADALNEMRVNGIAPDAKTRSFVEELRRDIGARTIWQEERNIGTGEVLDLLNQIETLSREPLKKDAEQQQLNATDRKRKSKVWRTSTAEQWKLGDEGHDRNYKFGDWDFSRKRKSKGNSSNHRRQPAAPPQTDNLAFE